MFAWGWKGRKSIKVGGVYSFEWGGMVSGAVKRVYVKWRAMADGVVMFGRSLLVLAPVSSVFFFPRKLNTEKGTVYADYGVSI